MTNTCIRDDDNLVLVNGIFYFNNKFIYDAPNGLGKIAL